MMRAPRRVASSTICATSRRGMRSVTTTMSLMPFSIASKTASFVKAGRDRDDGAVDRAAVRLDGLRDRVVDRHAVDVAALAARRDAAHDLRALAVVQALAGQVDGLAARDALDDERRGRVDEDAHVVATASDPAIFATARRAASCIETERSA